MDPFRAGQRDVFASGHGSREGRDCSRIDSSIAADGAHGAEHPARQPAPTAEGTCRGHPVGDYDSAVRVSYGSPTVAAHPHRGHPRHRPGQNSHRTGPAGTRALNRSRCRGLYKVAQLVASVALTADSAFAWRLCRDRRAVPSHRNSRGRRSQIIPSADVRPAATPPETTRDLRGNFRSGYQRSRRQADRHPSRPIGEDRAYADGSTSSARRQPDAQRPAQLMETRRAPRLPAAGVFPCRNRTPCRGGVHRANYLVSACAPPTEPVPLGQGLPRCVSICCRRQGNGFSIAQCQRRPAGTGARPDDYGDLRCRPCQSDLVHLQLLRRRHGARRGGTLATRSSGRFHRRLAITPLAGMRLTHYRAPRPLVQPGCRRASPPL